MPPLVSVILPTYNRRALLRKALASAAAQDYRPVELIVVDDGSTDGTEADVAEQAARLGERGVPLRYARQANAGPARARNAGVALAGGSFVAFLDSDDLWEPAFVSTLRRLLDQYPTAGLAFGGMRVIDEHDRPWALRPTGLEDAAPEGLLPKPFPALLRHMPLGTPCVMARKAVLDQVALAGVGPFDTGFRVGEDWDLWYRISRRYDFAYTTRPLTLCREHPNNIPKWNASAWSEMVKLDLKQLPEVSDEPTRQMLKKRIRQQSLLLQEQLLREGKGGNGSAAVLDAVSAGGLAPRSLRFRVGSTLRRGPRWAGKAYASAVRAVGALVRVGRPGAGGKG